MTYCFPKHCVCWQGWGLISYVPRPFSISPILLVWLLLPSLIPGQSRRTALTLNIIYSGVYVPLNIMSIWHSSIGVVAMAAGELTVAVVFFHLPHIATLAQR